MKPVHTFYEQKFIENLNTLQCIERDSGAKILCAFKGYAPHHSADLMTGRITGVAVSSLNELGLAKNYFPEMEVHTYCPAYDPDTFHEMAANSDVMVFNSIQDLERYEDEVPSIVGIDLRLNLQHSVPDSQVFDGYNPNKPYSRFGVTLSELEQRLSVKMSRLSGLHFHSLNQQDASDLEQMVNVLEKNFQALLEEPAIERINLGGGHAITREGYDHNLLKDIIKHLRIRYKVDVFLEPSEYVFHHTGTLEATVLSIVHNEIDIAILNVSAKNHMPDILESPYYFAEIKEGEYQGSGAFQYMLGGNTCLTGDVIGKYSFDKPLEVGDKITFLDQTAYTMSQSHFFNGIDKPTLQVIDPNGDVKSTREYTYKDYFRSL